MNISCADKLHVSGCVPKAVSFRYAQGNGFLPSKSKQWQLSQQSPYPGSRPLTARLCCRATDEEEEENRVGPKKPKREDVIEMEGVIVKNLPGDSFGIELENGFMVTAYISGNIRRRQVKIVVGDKVRVELSVYDLAKGRITYRFPTEFQLRQMEEARKLAEEGKKKPKKK